MQTARGKADLVGRKAKLANSYQELLDEFANKDLKSVGNYTLGRLIGKGSFGKVYLASHKLINNSKVVLKSANKTDSNLAREIHHHRQFIHPHIARLYEVIVTENLVWLVLEYCPGDELYNYLLSQGALPVYKVQKIFAQLVGAVSYVHQQSCVHRDLKLENILLDKNENVKLVDFGFTREYEGKANYLQTFCGTICYSAPEMLKAEKYAGEKVDVWSLGVILYALLCGELPFDDDDDAVTRNKILTEDPKFPEHLPADAVSLMKSLLSKRTLLRPSLPDILAHPFLSEYAASQQAILQSQAPPTFSTHLEKETLHRMKGAGVNIDAVIESVVAQRCDALAGWWSLLIEKEEKKLRRKEQKRRERDVESRSLRRLSAASSRLERMAPVLPEVDEDGGFTSGMMRLGEQPLPRTRGRTERRSAHYTDFELPGLPEHGKESGGSSPDVPPRPVDKDSIRSASTSRHRRPIPPPKEGVIRSARSRGSTLHLVTTTEALSSNGPGSTEQDTEPQKVRKRPSQAIVATWKNWTHWFYENTRRHRHANKRGSHSTPNLVDKNGSVNGSEHSKEPSPRPQTSKYPAIDSGIPRAKASLPKGVVANGHIAKAMPPAPMGGGLHSPTRVLPATPTTSSFPSSLRLVRGSGPPAPISVFNEGMPSSSTDHQAPGSPNPFGAGGVLFAKRKRSLFKGPMLSLNGGGSSARSTGSGSHSRSASASGLGRRSGEITIQEEEEDDETGDDYIEEVENFTPVVSGPGERVEEQIIEEGESTDNETTPRGVASRASHHTGLEARDAP
ncbi:putative serine/threonine-protein kinase like [Verticillium longisporum]|uniref:Putative serine/threonine-protein kinase like n=1 Tax=Verticillium longisporum TaxID=100787 RepID=A0A8I2ZJ79_VERLO|nr:putative serine/threonine-protein kinase like [Verticillium longisporum]